MGNLNRFNLSRLINDYKTFCLFETGTFLGDGVAYGLKFPFKQILSVEIVPKLAQNAMERFIDCRNVEILQTDSISGLKRSLPGISSNILFWLDAHYPGADAGLARYDDPDHLNFRLPLHKEIEIISSLRVGYNDVFILDDLRIYEDGDFENGNVPEDAMPKENRNIDFIFHHFGNTHLVFRCYRDEGYTLLFPQKTYKRKHFTLASLFSRKKNINEDHYLVE